jgi:serine/threonine protein kinase
MAICTNKQDDFIGKIIGVFELKKELGRGGMGAVYLAKRVDGEFSQKVAVKLIKRGMDTDFIVKRFRHERQILASLNHPEHCRFNRRRQNRRRTTVFCDGIRFGQSAVSFL